jgi:hypothetical protein
MAQRILVPFQGEGSGVGELSWGQREMWPAVCRDRTSMGVGGVLPLPADATVQDVVNAVRFMMSRHQSLRTRMVFDAGDEPRQVVSEAGELSLEIVDADEDPAGVAAALWLRYHEVKFDFVNEWPVRVAVVRHRGRPTHWVSLCCHLAIDGFGLTALRADLSTMDDPAPVTALPPLEQARWQRSPAGRRQSETALAYWAQVLRAIPARRFARSADRSEPPYREVNFSSPALHLAARMIAARTGTDTSSVLLAAFAVALAGVTGINPTVVQVVVSNRFRPGLVESISTISHPGLCVIDVAGVTLDEAAGRAGRALLRAYKNAYYDPAAKAELLAAVERERGEPIDLSCFFNDRRVVRTTGPLPGEPELRAALEATELRWVRPLDAVSERIFFHLNNVADTIDVRLSVDTRHISPAGSEALLRGMEAVAVGAATDPTTRTGVPARQLA